MKKFGLGFCLCLVLHYVSVFVFGSKEIKERGLVCFRKKMNKKKKNENIRERIHKKMKKKKSEKLREMFVRFVVKT